MSNLSGMHTTIISPESEIYSGSTYMVVLPGEEGDFAAMADHAPIVTYLRKGKIEVINEEGNKKTIYFAGGGFVKVENNKCIIMVDYIKSLKNIDVEKNEILIKKLQKKIEEEKDIITKRNLTDEIELLKSENLIAQEKQ
mgnify:CR=1 FL=1